MRTRPFAAFAAALLLTVNACGDERNADGLDPTELDYAPGLQVDFDQMERSSTGLYHRDLQVGSGQRAEAGRTVVVHYTGSFPDGTVFDSSREREEPFTLGLGQGQVIAGWDEGLQGMQEGGRRILVLPPHLAYGEAGAGGVIPPNAVLVFDVELLEVR